MDVEGEEDGMMDAQGVLPGPLELGDHEAPTGSASSIAAQLQHGLHLVCTRSLPDSAAGWLSQLHCKHVV